MPLHGEVDSEEAHKLTLSTLLQTHIHTYRLAHAATIVCLLGFGQHTPQEKTIAFCLRLVGCTGYVQWQKMHLAEEARGTS